MIFYLKKAVDALLLPPGIIILLLIYSGMRFLRKGYLKAGMTNLIIASIAYLLSIQPVADGMLKGLEGGYTIPDKPEGDVIVVLGGGIRDGVPDLTGKGAPLEDALPRIVAAARLQKRLGLPVIASGGTVFSRESEASVMKRFLVDLGVPEDKIIPESKSRDTYENALYTKEICEKMGFKRPILITSATHMRRAVMSFEKVGLPVTPFPSHFRVWERKRYSWRDYLPSAGAIGNIYMALHEYLGLIFYRVVY